MPLPKIDHPIHEVYLKSLGKIVKFRPFLVKEEKILLIARESQEVNDIRTAVYQVIKNCCIDEIDIDSLPLFDIEMFFVHLRMKSIGDSVKMQFTCTNIAEGSTEPCNKVTDYNIDLKNVKYEIDEEVSDIVKITESVGLKLKYPTMAIFRETSPDEFFGAISLITDNIEYIYDADSIYYRKDISEAEILEFLDELTIDQIEAIRLFFNKQPKVVLEDTVKCSSCGYEHYIKTEDLYSFFI
jgi:CRISPR/Cas system-associated exonuclease Cas4 (RecB family)